MGAAEWVWRRHGGRTVTLFQSKSPQVGSACLNLFVPTANRFTSLLIIWNKQTLIILNIILFHKLQKVIYTIYKVLSSSRVQNKSPDPSRICFDLPSSGHGALSRPSVASIMATPRSLPTNESARRQPSLLESDWWPSLSEAVRLSVVIIYII